MRQKPLFLGALFFGCFSLFFFLFASCETPPDSKETPQLTEAPVPAETQTEETLPGASFDDSGEDADLVLPPDEAGEAAAGELPEISELPPEAPDAAEETQDEAPPEAIPPDLVETALPPDTPQSEAFTERPPEPAAPEIPADEPVVVPPPSPPPPLPPPERTEPAPPREVSPPPSPPLLRPPEKDTPPPPAEPSAGFNAVPGPPVVPAPLPDEKIIFSRVVRALVGQLVEIPFRGAGWVYLGELGSRRGISYDSRRLDPEGQTFVFRAGEAGTYVLKFYRQDFIRDYVLNDYVQVIIGEAPQSSGTAWFNPPLDTGRVIAEPRWPLVDGPDAATQTLPAAPPEEAAAGTPAGQIAEPPQVESPLPAAAENGGSAEPGAASNDGNAQTETAAAAGTVPVSQAAEAVPGSVSAMESAPPLPAGTDTAPQIPAREDMPDYVRRAKEEFDAGRTAAALSIMDQLKQRYPVLSDEALWLYGQLLEANGPGRDIRLALDCYRRLVREYPQSPRFSGAEQRVSYLERYYFTIK